MNGSSGPGSVDTCTSTTSGRGRSRDHWAREQPLDLETVDSPMCTSASPRYELRRKLGVQRRDGRGSPSSGRRGRVVRARDGGDPRPSALGENLGWAQPDRRVAGEQPSTAPSTPTQAANVRLRRACAPERVFVRERKPRHVRNRARRADSRTFAVPVDRGQTQTLDDATRPPGRCWALRLPFGRVDARRFGCQVISPIHASYQALSRLVVRTAATLPPAQSYSRR